MTMVPSEIEEVTLLPDLEDLVRPLLLGDSEP